VLRQGAFIYSHNLGFLYVIRRLTWNLCSSVLLCSVSWFLTNVLGWCIGPIFKGQDFQEENFFFTSWLLNMRLKRCPSHQWHNSMHYTTIQKSKDFNYNVAEALNITAAELLWISTMPFFHSIPHYAFIY